MVGATAGLGVVEAGGVGGGSEVDFVFVLEAELALLGRRKAGRRKCEEDLGLKWVDMIIKWREIRYHSI